MGRRLFFLFLVALAVVAIWRPDWRGAAVQAASPYARRAWIATLERIGRPPGRSHAASKPELPTPATEPVPPDPAPADASQEQPHGEPVGPPADAQEQESGPAGNLPPRLPGFRAEEAPPPGLKALRAQAAARPGSVLFRRLADLAAEQGFPEIAAEAYLKEAALYRKQGDPNAAVIEELKAGRYRAEGRLYIHEVRTPDVSASLGRLEPPRGCLLGAFIDRDDELPTTFMDENWQTHREEEEFAQRVGKKHASLFCYLKYGKPFPSRWAERLRNGGVIPHIAWEPGSLAEVKDDAYLNGFADAVAALDAPVFIRFAGEMNGAWTPYHGDPARYREKFRLVYTTLTRRAPRVAVIWCVNNIPDAEIDAYYPGDDAVDWVGVNFYNVLYFDNKKDQPADTVHPVDLLQPIYRRYAARKPIALCEYAASHQAAVDPTPRPDYAVLRLSQLYAALPRLFPRVKLVDWFDCNNLKQIRPDRQLNNYSLTDDPLITRAYGRAVRPSYFLGRAEDRPDRVIRPLTERETVQGIVTLSAWARSPVERPRTYLLADDQVLYAGDEPGPPVCRWDARQAGPGTHTLRLIVADAEGRKLLDRKQAVRVAAL